MNTTVYYNEHCYVSSSSIVLVVVKTAVSCQELTVETLSLSLSLLPPNHVA